MPAGWIAPQPAPCRAVDGPPFHASLPAPSQRFRRGGVHKRPAKACVAERGDIRAHARFEEDAIDQLLIPLHHGQPALLPNRAAQRGHSTTRGGRRGRAAEGSNRRFGHARILAAPPAGSNGAFTTSAPCKYGWTKRRAQRSRLPPDPAKTPPDFSGDDLENGGPDQDRTDDLRNAIAALFQLSYEPILPCGRREKSKFRQRTQGLFHPLSGSRARKSSSRSSLFPSGRGPMEPTRRKAARTALSNSALPDGLVIRTPDRVPSAPM